MPLGDIPMVLEFLNSAPRPEIKLMVSDNGGTGISMYGNRRTSQKIASAVFRLEFSDTSDSTDMRPLSSIKSRTAPKSVRISSKDSTGPMNSFSALRSRSKTYTSKMSNSLVSVESMLGPTKSSSLHEDSSLVQSSSNLSPEQVHNM
jgi:hypothetical protein